MNKIKKTDHFYLIDGSGYIFRAYYALPPLSRKSDGLPTGAVNGFCNMLYKLLEDGAFEMLKSLCADKRKNKLYLFELFNIIIESGLVVKAKEPKGMTIREIDSLKDL